MNMPCIAEMLPMANPFIAPTRGRKPAHGLPASLLRPGRGTGKFRVHNCTAAQARGACDAAFERSQKR